MKAKKIFKIFGPGIIVAATGIGAGDLIAAAVSGAQYGYALLWAAVIGALLKYVLNEGISRWQLVNNSSLLQAWTEKLNVGFSWYFFVYLILWSFIVAAALMAACGLAAHAIIPSLSVAQWGIIHSLLAAVLVLAGKYKHIERLMKFFIALMFIITISSAILIKPDLFEILKSVFIPQIPEGSLTFIFGVIGGVGGSVTLLSYGYWIREKNWKGSSYIKQSRIDLGFAYALTGIFGLAIMIVAAGAKPEVMKGNLMVLELANRMGEVTSSAGKWIFLIGFWGAVFSSMIGVWHGIPYLFADFIQLKFKSKKTKQGQLSKSNSYKYYVLYLALPPIILLFMGKPVWIVILYAVAGAFFMPFLALTLLYLNSKITWLKEYKNSVVTKIILVISLLIFAFLMINQILNYF